MQTQGRFRIKQNVQYVLRDKNGNFKRLFQPNKLATWLIGHGVISPRISKIPFLFGNFAERMVISNLVVDAGKAAVAGLINGVITNFFEYIAIGTGTVAPAAGDTALGAEITTGGGARAAGTTSRVTTDVTNDTAQVVLTFNFTASFAVTESGVLDSAAAGILLARQTFSAINVVSGDSLQVTWKLDVD
ncbi:hypothetical protein HY504_02725 [Candidatus Wolfebacteria bacterium]|nr:hypothetical protein [Candidatus Wolfebacteria bacterium]